MPCCVVSQYRFLFLLTLTLNPLIIGVGGGLFAGYFRVSPIYQGLQHVEKYGGAKNIIH